MKNHTTDELHIIVNHVPGNFGTTGYPAIFINGLVPFYRYIFFFYTQVTVQLCCCGNNFFIFFEATGRFFYYGKCFGKNFKKYFFNLFVAVFFSLSTSW